MAKVSAHQVAVIGGGVIGTACARAAALRQLHTVILEPGPDPAAASPASAGRRPGRHRRAARRGGRRRGSAGIAARPARRCPPPGGEPPAAPSRSDHHHRGPRHGNRAGGRDRRRRAGRARRRRLVTAARGAAAAARRDTGPRPDGRHAVARRDAARHPVLRSRVRSHAGRGGGARQHDGARRVRLPGDQRGTGPDLPLRGAPAPRRGAAPRATDVGGTAARDSRRPANRRSRPRCPRLVLRDGPRSQWSAARGLDRRHHRRPLVEGVDGPGPDAIPPEPLMYTTCAFCNGKFDGDGAPSALGVGRRLAFDEWRGRLWGICPTCARWKLTPLDDRLERVDALARTARAGHLVASTDEVALLRWQRYDLVRVGKPPRVELAPWRYGERLRARQRERARVVIPLTLAAVGLGIAANVAAGGSLGVFAWNLHAVADWTYF